MNNVVLIRFVIQIYKNVYRDAHKIHSVQINKYVQLMVNVENVQIINNVQIKHNMPVKIIFVISIQEIAKHVLKMNNVVLIRFVIQIYKNVYRDAHKIHSVQINKYVQLMVNVENV